ncbi:hypothetical protein BC332_22852 [Capsicum chinense]|nr:hypothetical protein BC332_22852 [Capsicum chinense]
MIEEFELNDDESGFSLETVAGRSGKRPVVDIQSQSDPDIQGFEDFSTLPPTKIIKKAGFLSDASASQHTKRRRTVHFDSATVEEQVYQKTPSSISTRTIYSVDDPMDDHYFDWNRSPIQKQSEEVEGVSADIGPATLESLVAVVKNLKPDSANVDYSSTLPESAQVELDIILKGIAAPVDDLSIEVVPSSEAIMNKHDISDSQLPKDFSDAVVAAHQAAKTPARRTRTRSKVFMSPYTTEYASGSKAIEDQIGEPKQKFAFDGFLISDNMPRGVIEEYKQWVEEGLLKFHAKKNDQDYRFTTTNYFFKNYIVKTYSNYYEDDTDSVITTQQDYAQSVDVVLNEDAITNIIKGYCMPSGLPWHQVDEVYVPIN